MSLSENIPKVKKINLKNELVFKRIMCQRILTRKTFYNIGSWYYK